MTQNDGTKRFDRVVSILIQLQTKRIVKAQELVARFGVSLRTIYRDIRTLEASGVPIYSEAGVGYALMEGYRLPPIMFTQEEAASFVAAEKLMHKFTDPVMRKDFEAAMYKLKAVLRANDRDWVSSIENQVVMQPTESKFNTIVPNALSILFESIARKTQIQIKYEAPGHTNSTERVIETVGVFHQHNYWYIIAYCHLRENYRQFRIDRIQKIIPTEKKFTLAHESLHYYLDKKEVVETTKVVIEVPHSLSDMLRWERNYFGFVEEQIEEDKITMHFEVQNLDNGFARWFLMFGDQAKIIEPIQLKNRIKELLNLQLEKLNGLQE